MSLFGRRFRLAGGADALGLSCGPTGVALAGAPLLRESKAGFAPRTDRELKAIMKAAYGSAIGARDLRPGLALIAKALNDGDIGRAMVATLRLGLPEMNWGDAVRIAKVEDALLKYDPDEPRDLRGRWTTGGGSSGGQASPPPRAPERRFPGASAASEPAPDRVVDSLDAASAPKARLDEGVYYPSQPPDLIDVSGRTFAQTVTWSPPSCSASPGQSGTAWAGAQALQAAYASGKGGDYWVDPKTMQMENSIDIGAQIQQSVNEGGFMRGVLSQALSSGKPMIFNSSKWGKTGLLRFDDGPFMPDGQTVGRFGGFVIGTLTATGDGHYSVTGVIIPIKTGPFSYAPDAASAGGDVVIVAAGLVPDLHNNFEPNMFGKPFNIKFTRVAHYSVIGTFGH